MKKYPFFQKINLFLTDWMGKKISASHGFWFVLTVLAICTGAGYLFYLLNFAESNIVTIYILGVLIISARTMKTGYSIFSAIAGILLFNCLYAEPPFTLLYYDPRHTVTMIMLMVAALIVGYFSQQFQRRMEERAKLALEAESERLRINLLRSIGHDLRTPLTSISGDVQILLDKGDVLKNESRDQLYQEIYDNSEWLISVVENLLYVTRFDNGSMAIEKQPELLSDLLAESLKHINKKKDEHTFLFDIQNDLLFVNVDGHMIMQVIINILNNAIKHTQADSTIWITLKEQNGKAVLEIADNGPGVKDKGDRVFDLFYSKSNMYPEEKLGFGLGLTLSKAIIEAHDGSIYYKNNVPQGAIFGFALPIERMEELDDNRAGN